MNIPIDRSRIELIGACTIDGAYGLGNAMPWSGEKKGLPGDMSRFKQITKDAPEGMVNLLIAGRITAETMKSSTSGPNDFWLVFQEATRITKSSGSLRLRKLWG